MSGNKTDMTVVEKNETYPRGIEDYRIDNAIRACKVVEIGVLLFSVWILLCAIIYGFKTKKWRKKPGSNSLDQGIMYLCCVAAIALTLPRILFTTFTLFMHADILSPVCEAIVDTSNGLYVVAAYVAYFYLWLRQRAIYFHPAAQKLAEKCVVLSGWIVIFAITGSSIAIGCAYMIPDTYAGSPKGCVMDREKEGHKTLLVAIAGLHIVSQVFLLALFIYPMIRCELGQVKKQRRSAAIPQASTPGGEAGPDGKVQCACWMWRRVLCGSSDSNQGASLARTIRRSVYGALIAMTSDISVMLIASFGMPSSTPGIIPTTLYDVSISINSLCILSTFGNNRKILSVFWSCPVDFTSEGKSRE